METAADTTDEATAEDPTQDEAFLAGLLSQIPVDQNDDAIKEALALSMQVRAGFHHMHTCVFCLQLPIGCDAAVAAPLSRFCGIMSAESTLYLCPNVRCKTAPKINTVHVVPACT